ncbi:MAG: hypothetical protein ACHQEM_08390 [Chitinophagales bacterium]
MKWIAGLAGLILLISSCTKTITQVQQVDQAFSTIYTLQPAGWGSPDGGLSYSTNLNVPEIDQAMLNNGAILVYLSFDNGANYEAIPEVFDGISYGSLHSLGLITLDLHAVDGSKINGPGGTILAKVVLVQGTPLQ